MNKEIFVLFHVVDENLSWYIDESIKEFSPDKTLLDKNDEAFKHGNLIHGRSLFMIPFWRLPSIPGALISALLQMAY